MVYKTLKHKTLPNTFGILYYSDVLGEEGIMQSSTPILMSNSDVEELNTFVEFLKLENYELVEVELKFLNNE